MKSMKNSSADCSAAHLWSSAGLAIASNDIVVGFNDDLLAIKEQLCGNSTNLQVIPIVGMGGIGKTTLAKNAYHDPLIRESFYIGGWVTVSQSYNVEEILTTLQQSLKPFDAIQSEESHESREQSEAEFFDLEVKKLFDKKNESDHVEEIPLFDKKNESDHVEENPTALQQSLKLIGVKPSEEGHESREQYRKALYAKNSKKQPESTGDQVYKTLKGRKYLIVMDDIWNTEVCDHLKRIFPNDDNGSRVILTTRLQDVATYAQDCSPHEMRLMHEDQSWDLLRQKVVMKGVCTRGLEDIGMTIARSCGGLPLAIIVIAGLLSMVDNTRASWEDIKERVNSNVVAKDGQFEKILSLSYTHLSRYLRQCFVYMGGFPEDHEIHVAKLIKLWIAEGFVEAISASKSLEEEAEECLQDLIRRSLVLVCSRKPDGKMKSCRLHDLMRDLCIRKAYEEKFLLHGSVNIAQRVKNGCSEDARYLRVMDVGKKVTNSYPAIPEFYKWFPEQIFRLSNLRYLVLTYFVEIPAAILYLENLQTFIIHAMEGSVRLPLEIWRMPKLRHLVSLFDPLPCPEGEDTSSCLESLQTLFEVSNLEFTARLVEMIPNLRKMGLLYSGSYEFEQVYNLDNFLGLSQLENLFNPARYYDYNLENLERLQQLEALKVQVYPGFEGMLNPVYPKSLKKLSLSGWRLTSWKDMAIIGLLPNLQVLKLRDLRSQDKKWETTEDNFPRLSFLLIERSGIREWITESEHFPSLKQLLLHCCSYLDEIPSEIGDITTLELIEVKEGSTLLIKSATRIEEEQKDLGNDSLYRKIFVIFHQVL